jgi:DNA-binding Xre family transcriptional regulator
MSAPESLRKLIDKDKRTQTEIAATARILRVNLSQFMTRGRSLTFDALERLADALEADIVVVPRKKKPVKAKAPSKPSKPAAKKRRGKKK